MGKTIILGAGLAGLSVSYHLGHQNCVVLEGEKRMGGHIRSRAVDGFVWDEGPHVSFTKNSYVKDLFAESVGDEFEQFEATVGNYFRGSWIDHPAQVALHQLPEPLRTQCLESFREARAQTGFHREPLANYHEWLLRAFGSVFAETFPAAYTRKYWTVDARRLTTDWVGHRMLYPREEDVIAGARGPLGRPMHYITTVRYPRYGGYESYLSKIRVGADVRLNSTVTRIDLVGRRVVTLDGVVHDYDQLVCTIPLPEFVRLCPAVPLAVQEAARSLSCTELMLVNLTAPHVTRRPETWFYVYDCDMLSTRVNFTEHLSRHNAPPGSTGVQVEVYGSRHRPFEMTPDEIVAQVRREAGQMGLLDPAAPVQTHAMQLRWANVIFDHDTRPAVDTIWTWLEQFGLQRESDDTHPLTDWDENLPRPPIRHNTLAFAGRYAQWKYFWTDDCVLRGRQFARR
jgi:protoporphyrinogen oxidase